LKSYSGRAEYRTTFSLPAGTPEGRILLDLGEVAVSASVTVNGQKVGTAYRRPYRFDISEAARAGENALTVEVANTVANHFARETPTDYVFEGQRRSGLIGPVTLSVQPRASVRIS
jgi:beta-galactosidase/beta-glucuronidase